MKSTQTKKWIDKQFEEIDKTSERLQEEIDKEIRKVMKYLHLVN